MIEARDRNEDGLKGLVMEMKEELQEIKSQIKKKSFRSASVHTPYLSLASSWDHLHCSIKCD